MHVVGVDVEDLPSSVLVEMQKQVGREVGTDMETGCGEPAACPRSLLAKPQGDTDILTPPPPLNVPFFSTPHLSTFH